ncbi:MAG: FG-GAP-like repeat-containing protein, partial [Calditrichota bacterium]
MLRITLPIRLIIWLCQVLLILLLSSADAQEIDKLNQNRLPTFEDTLRLEGTAERSANVAFGDLNSDGNLDIVLAKGRHWPLVNQVFLGNGRGNYLENYGLDITANRSYSASLADMDADGDLDIVVSNDKPDENVIYMNDGFADFIKGSSFGKAGWPTRNASVVDLSGDGLPDIVVANRGKTGKSYICINQGNGKFGADCIELSDYGSTTITPADFNRDGLMDLAVPHRDGGQGYVFLQTSSTELKFKKIPFGTPDDAVRMSQAADINGDNRIDLITIDTNRGVMLHYQKEDGAFLPGKSIDSGEKKPYALATSDLNWDSKPDIIVGYIESLSEIYFNSGAGNAPIKASFGDGLGTVYGFDIADFNKDGVPDIAAARSGAQNVLYFGKVPKQQINQDWPSFRGAGGKGVSEGYSTRASWNADSSTGEINGVLWKTPLPGLGHSSPIILGNRLIVASAIAEQGDAPLMIGRGGQSTAAADSGKQSWMIFCYDKTTGAELWRRTARSGIPKASRHMKATHANTSLASDGKRLVAFFGSEGLYCYDLDGLLLWKKDLGVVDVSKYGIGWGYSSSPVIHDDKIVLVCDDPDNPYAVTLRLSDGEEVWRVSRKGISERSWGTPFIHSNENRTQVVINGWPWVMSYGLETGDEIWKIQGGGDNPVPTPYEANGWFYLSSSHGGKSPIYVVRPEATGDITPSTVEPSNEGVVWSVEKGGSYLSTSVVYDDLLFLGNTNGSIRCFDALTGEKLFQERLDVGAGIIASLVAVDEKIYAASE